VNLGRSLLCTEETTVVHNLSQLHPVKGATGSVGGLILWYLPEVMCLRIGNVKLKSRVTGKYSDWLQGYLLDDRISEASPFAAAVRPAPVA
jgi:hypothetical protein